MGCHVWDMGLTGHGVGWGYWGGELGWSLQGPGRGDMGKGHEDIAVGSWEKIRHENPWICEGSLCGSRVAATGGGEG